MTGTERRIRLARALRIVFAVIVALDSLVLAVDLAQGSPVAAVPAACILAMLLLVIAETRLIGTLQRTRELTRRADQLELAAEATRAKAGACAHPDAEPVDLSTGERVAWVCPDCDAELPAGWTPQAKGAVALTAMPGVSAGPAPSGTGSLSARARVTGRACDCGKCGKASREFDRQLREQVIASQGIPPARAVTATDAAEHFEALARVGMESCVSPCSICEERDLRTAHGYHLDGAGREWLRVGDLWWIRPAPGAPWVRQDKPEGGEQQ